MSALAIYRLLRIRGRTGELNPVCPGKTELNWRVPLGYLNRTIVAINSKLEIGEEDLMKYVLSGGSCERL
jgi:hypothetical protein